jgi:alpha-L-fucosidase
MVEVVDRYHPDVIWYDFGLRGVPDRYKEEFLAYYFNQAAERQQEVVVTYKDFDLAPGVGVVDLELGRMNTLTNYEWITDTTVDNGQGWGYLKDTRYKSTTTMVHYLIDNVSKNGYLLLNVGPKPDGTLPEESKDILRGVGAWLKINGEAIFGSRCWTTYGEGPTQIKKGGAFNEDEGFVFGPQDVRFTLKGNALYAIVLGWPGEQVTIRSLQVIYPNEIQSIRMLGTDQELKWSLSENGLTIQAPDKKPCEHAYVFKIIRGNPFGG